MNTATVEVRERPVNAYPHEVRSILEGRQTQLRRVMKLPPRNPKGNRGGMLYYGRQFNCVSDGVIRFLDWKCPYGQPGERLWVRESIHIDDYQYSEREPLPKTRPADIDDESIYYRADGECCRQIPECACGEVGKTKWRSPSSMPRWASRINLEIVSVRVERLQEINADDCASEGIQYPVRQSDIEGKVSPLLRVTGQYPPTKYLPREYGHDDLMRAHFASGWDSINAKRGYPWSSNPFVWAITFNRL